MDTPIFALEPYQYTSLQPGDSTFRVLKLLKNQGPEIECQLSERSLTDTDHIPYEALSYVWGSPELVECIILDGKRFWVTDSLYSALQCLRLRNRDRYLWIDAICINQADKNEQGHQVHRMGSIYGFAEKVLFWLGKATSEIITLMDALSQQRNTSSECNLGQWMLDDNCIDICRTGLRQLLRRQWFTRVWILQEVATARKATVCCGTWSIPAEIFARAPSVVKEEPEPHCQAVLDVMPGPSRSGSWWGQKRNLCTLVRKFQASKATDERDKIYALLGMSSDPSDIQSIDIDYQKPTHQTISSAITYLLRSTPVSVHEIINLMSHFETLETIYFVLPFRDEEATEILFPYLQSGNVLKKPQELEFFSRGIAVIKNPALFLFEKRAERNLKEEETCYTQVVGQTNKIQEHENYDNGLEVYSWGRDEHRVKIVVVYDRKEAVLQAALKGHDRIVRHLLHLEIGVEEGKVFEDQVLQEAVEQDHFLAVQTILRQTTPVGVRDRIYGNALQSATCRGNKQVVELLLDACADVNAQGGKYGNALQAASKHGHKQIVELLLNAGADVNAQGGKYGNALQAATVHGENKQVVELLLDAGANINAQGGVYGNALTAASGNSDKQIVELLLNAGADINAQGGLYGNALQAACVYENKQIVELLLNAGADVHAQGGLHGNALQAASKQGHKQIVELLLDAGADVNAQGGEFGNALQAASRYRDKQIVELLLDAGADVNAQGGLYGNVLQAACVYGYKQTVELLLDAGADVNAQGGPYGNALLAVNVSDNNQISELLLDAGAKYSL